MRDYLNNILSVIGAESLTDGEFNSITIEDNYDQIEGFDVLLSILQAREVVSDMTSRLQYYFLAMGVEVSQPNNSTSNIFVGSPL